MGKALVTSLIALMLVGCSKVNLLNFLIPKSGYQTFTNIAYGSLPRQHLDIYVPANKVKSAATIVFFYGGSWQLGNKELYRFVGQAFASKGFVTVIADYRVYPQNYFPDFMEDAAKTMVWVHQHIKQYGGNPNKLFIAGHSAGAYNAVMLTLNKKYLQALNSNDNFIKGVIGIAGPYDFKFTEVEVKALFGHAPYPETQPINYVRANLPPMLLATGDKDTEVYPRNAFNLYNKLLKYKNPVQLILIHNVGHVGIVLSLAYPFQFRTNLLNDIEAFVNSHS